MEYKLRKGSEQEIWSKIAFTVLLVSVWILPGISYTEDNSRTFDYEDYALVLKTYVDDRGMVDYGNLKAHRDQLDAFAERLEKLEPASYEGWIAQQKIAFWLNAYNGLTLVAIIDNYPIRPSFFRSRLYPKNSIRQIGGVWDKLQFPVMGMKITLDEIEHKILRKEFNEPRIHMALVCAAMGCPPLRNKPYTGKRLVEQLDDQTQRFLKNPRKFRVDREDRRIYLSSIFRWFGKDFIPAYGTDQEFSGYRKTERALLNFVSDYLDEETRDYLVSEKLSVKYLDYDWSLNEQ
jgi:hypothetical protein